MRHCVVRAAEVEADPGTDPVAIGRRARERDAQLVVRAAVVAEEPRRTVVGRDEQVEIAVVVVVAVRRSAADHRAW